MLSYNEHHHRCNCIPISNPLSRTINRKVSFQIEENFYSNILQYAKSSLWNRPVKQNYRKVYPILLTNNVSILSINPCFISIERTNRAAGRKRQNTRDIITNDWSPLKQVNLAYLTCVGSLTLSLSSQSSIVHWITFVRTWSVWFRHTINYSREIHDNRRRKLWRFEVLERRLKKKKKSRVEIKISIRRKKEEEKPGLVRVRRHPEDDNRWNDVAWIPLVTRTIPLSLLAV